MKNLVELCRLGMPFFVHEVCILGVRPLASRAVVVKTPSGMVVHFLKRDERTLSEDHAGALGAGRGHSQRRWGGASESPLRERLSEMDP